MHELMAHQTAMGHDVHVFATRHPKNFSTPDQKYFVERFDLDRREGLIRDLFKAKNYVWNGEARLSLAHMLQDLRPDMIHMHNAYNHLSSSILTSIRLSRIPCVQTLHDYKLASANYALFAHGEVCEHGKQGKYWEIVKHRCIQGRLDASLLGAFEMWMTKTRKSYERTVKLFLCPSQFMQRKMEEWGEPADQLRYVPNPTYFPEQSAPRGGGYALYAGRLSPEKGLEGFIHAASRVPELPIKIAGRGPEEEKLKNLAHALRAHHISFLGFIEPEKMKDVRDRAEAVVLPTLSYENASGALLEAMAAGIPCLATRTGGNPELVEDQKSGLLTPPGDEQAWEMTLRKFAQTTQEERTKMGEAGRKKIHANHLWFDHLERVQECYEEARSTSHPQKNKIDSPAESRAGMR